MRYTLLTGAIYFGLSFAQDPHSYSGTYAKLLIGSQADGGDSASSAVGNCKEYNADGSPTGVVNTMCIANAVGYMFNAAGAITAATNDFEANIRAGQGAAQDTATRKREAVDLQSLNAALQKRDSAITVSSVKRSDVGIDNAAHFGVSVRGSDVEVHTNGSHSLTRLRNRSPSSAKFRRAMIETNGIYYMFDGAIQGLKLSAVVEQPPTASQLATDMQNAGKQFVNDGTFQTSDAWVWSACVGSLSNAYGNLVVELNGFGGNADTVTGQPSCS